MLPKERLRNIAIIAHVDHGKTTLVDKLLRQADSLDARAVIPERAMDSNDLEKERGITILAKNTAISWHDWRINIVDTPGHADFGGEVERVLSMVDGVLLLVDAVDGPMPQTRFVTSKAFQHGFTPLVVINKVDREGSRADWVLDQTFDLFDRLGASDKQLDFPVIYASALKGYASTDANAREGDMQPLFEAIINNVPPPPVELEGPLQLQVSSLDYNSYVGLMGIGRISRGVVKRNMPVTLVQREGTQRNAQLMELYGFEGLTRTSITEAGAGDIVVFSGIEDLKISDTVCARGQGEGLPPLQVDEPTITMTFQVNKSPFAGSEGKYLTSRQIRARLQQELLHNVALRVEDSDDADRFRVSGRGELHLSVLIENMRREGYELAVSRPAVIERVVNGVVHEPWEQLTVDFALFDLQERGSLFIGHGVEVYEGMIIGINSRDNDLMVNPTKGKQLTNVRTQGADEKIILSPPIRFSLEQALEFIDDDELVEVTPTSVRLRKKLLTENERKRESRKAADG